MFAYPVFQSKQYSRDTLDHATPVSLVHRAPVAASLSPGQVLAVCGGAGGLPALRQGAVLGDRDVQVAVEFAWGACGYVARETVGGLGLRLDHCSKRWIQWILQSYHDLDVRVCYHSGLEPSI